MVVEIPSAHSMLAAILQVACVSLQIDAQGLPIGRSVYIHSDRIRLSRSVEVVERLSAIELWRLEL